MFARIAPHAAPARAAARLQTMRADDAEAGMSTAEYAVGTVAAAGFAGILYKLLTSDPVIELIMKILTKAFSLSFL